MSIATLFKRLFKGRHPQNNHTFTDADRERSAEKKQFQALTRQQNEILKEELEHLQQMQRQRQLKEQIAEMRFTFEEEDDYDDDEPEDDNDELLKNMLLGFISKAAPQQQTPIMQKAPNPSLSDDDIRKLLENLPEKYLKIARNMDNETLKRYIIGYAPNLDAPTIERTITIIRES